MDLLGNLFGQFIDVIDWKDDSGDTMVRRFERHGDEIKHGAKLVVREGQAAAFIHEGRLADVFPPGLYKLHTNNLPILSTLQHWDHGFQSPFKAEVYFVSTRRFTDMKWGTRNPVMLRDPEFGPIRLRAFGTYEVRVTDPGLFLREIVGTDGDFGAEEIAGQLRSLIAQRFSSAVATSRIPVLDLAAGLEDLSAFVLTRIAPELAEYGVTATGLVIENVSLPAEVERALDRRASMGVIGDIKKYAQFQAVEALRVSAENGGGGGLEMGVGMGAGVAMGRAFGQTLAAPAPQPAVSAAAAPPPLPAPESVWHVALDGQSRGPLSAEEVAALAARGRLGPETLVWRAGMAAWTPAQAVAELGAVLQSGPPPLPPSG